MSIEDAKRKKVMRKIIGAREYFKIGSFGVNAKKKEWREWHSPA